MDAISQDPASVHFHEFVRERWRQPCLRQKCQNYLWPCLLRELAGSMAGAGNIQDEPELSNLVESQNVHAFAHTYTHITMGAYQRAQEPTKRALNLSNKINNVVLHYNPKNKLNTHKSMLISLTE